MTLLPVSPSRFLECHPNGLPARAAKLLSGQRAVFIALRSASCCSQRQAQARSGIPYQVTHCHVNVHMMKEAVRMGWGKCGRRGQGAI